MDPVDIDIVPPGCVKVVYAKDQPQYQPLPTIKRPDGLIYSEWEPTIDEIERLCRGERVRLWVQTFNQPLQPVLVEVTSDDSVPTGPPKIN